MSLNLISAEKQHPSIVATTCTVASNKSTPPITASNSALNSQRKNNKAINKSRRLMHEIEKDDGSTSMLDAKESIINSTAITATAIQQTTITATAPIVTTTALNKTATTTTTTATETEIPTTKASAIAEISSKISIETGEEATSSATSIGGINKLVIFEEAINSSSSIPQLLSSSLSLKTQRNESRLDGTSIVTTSPVAAQNSIVTDPSTPTIEIFTDTTSNSNPIINASEEDIHIIACSGLIDENLSPPSSWTSSIASSLQSSLGVIATGLADQDLLAKINDSTDGVVLRSHSSAQEGSGDKQKNSTRLSVRAKKKSWYNVLYPNYKSRADDFKKLFKEIPNEERLIVDYSCALQREILLQGRMYVSQNYVCFHANIFRWETYLSIKWEEVESITKEKTALVIPNAISICTAKEKFFFATFTSRDKAYLMLFRVWQNKLMRKPMLPQEIWQWVHNCYGDELGLTTDDEDYIDPTSIQCDNDLDSDFISAIEDNSCSLAVENINAINSSNSNQSINQLGSSSNSSGTGSDTRSAGEISKLKSRFFSRTSNKTQHNFDKSSSHSDQMAQSNNDMQKQNIKEEAGDVQQLDATTQKKTDQTISEGDKGAVSKEPKSNNYDGKRKVTKNNRQRDENLSKNTENLPTDMSASSDSDENKIPFVATAVCNSPHEGRQIMHTILPINIETLFNIMFSGSKFMQEFHTMRRTENIQFGEWVPNKDGTQTRTVSLTVQVSASVGPKTSRVTENQLMRDCSKPGELYAIDVINTNAGIPYAESFCVMMHFCLVRTADDNTMLSMHAQIKYKKSIWGVMKNIIEKNTWAGIEEFYTSLLQALQNETNIPPAKGKGRRPRRGITAPMRSIDEVSPHAHAKIDTAGDASATTGLLTATQSAATSAHQFADESGSRYRWLSLFVVALLIFLIVLNAVLLNKLWQLEQRIDEDVDSRMRLPNLSQLKQLPNTNEEWVRLLREQELLHENELKKWHTVLQTAIELLRKTEKTLAAVMFQYQ